MGIISKLKSVLGVADGEHARSRDAGTPVAVEREPVASSERAVKGIDPGPDGMGDGDEATEVDDDSSRSTGGDEAPADDAGSARPRADGEPVDSIKGIGAAYEARLADAGVHTVADLAAADAAELAATTDIGGGRLETWIERAKARTR